MHNQDIDMLYSLTMNSESEGNQQFGQFGINSIRMKSSSGVAGAVSRELANKYRLSKVGRFAMTKAKFVLRRKILTS